jgi:hypothetical protein
MFAPLVAKAKSTGTQPAKAIDPAHMPHWDIGNQPTTRIVAPRANWTGDAPGAQTTGSATGQEAALSWDFSKIPVHPQGSAGRRQTPRFFAAARLPIQAKLKVGAIDDPLEHEADRVADHVMRMPAPEVVATSALPQITRKAAGESFMLQRKCACGGGAFGLAGECEECSKKRLVGLQAKLRAKEPGDAYELEADRVAEQVLAMPERQRSSNAPPQIQRYSGQSNGQMNTVPASVNSVLRSPGRPLDPGVRRDMELRFGHDFSMVRVHSDTAAEQSAGELNALAYTVGQNIVFGAGQFIPATQEGRRLIAHELTHVQQQSIGQTTKEVVQRSPDKDGHFADAVAACARTSPRTL